MKLRIGTTVRIKMGLKGTKRYGELYFSTEMERYCGKIYQIIGYTYTKRYKLDNSKWCFSDEMFDVLEKGKLDLSHIKPYPIVAFLNGGVKCTEMIVK